MGLPKFRITYGELKAAARIGNTRDTLKAQNYFSARKLEGSDHNAQSAVDKRLADGSGNDARRPSLGQTGTPFSRNSSAATLEASRAWDEPDPRVISRNLLHCHADKQQPAPGINLLSAAWIQFQVHDWFEHPVTEEAALSLGATNQDNALRLPRTKPLDYTFDDGTPAFANTRGHWWDASQIYGADSVVTEALRVRTKKGLLKAKLQIVETDKGKLLPFGAPLPEHEVDSTSVELSGFIKNWWVGLSALHTLFALEHNTIVDELRTRMKPGKHGCPAGRNKQAREDWLFERARLVNTALIAKIHTLEWTTAILDDPVMKLGLYADWWGNGTEGAARLFGLFSAYADAKQYSDDQFVEVSHLEELRAIPGVPEELIQVLLDLIGKGNAPDRLSPAARELDASGKPIEYAMSEEFVAVYRMHPLLADPVVLRQSDGSNVSRSLVDLSLANTRTLMEEYGLTQILESLVNDSPAALRLRNYPAGLATFRQLGSESAIDLGAVDILRDRERGVPRYAAFKLLVSKQQGPYLDDPDVQPIQSFMDICGDPDALGIDAVEQARRKRDIELLSQTYASPQDVDLLIGLLAEPLPKGFGFSWTAFEVFLLMAVFRLSQDRFFTEGFTKEIYTPFGIKWVNKRSMVSVLKAHAPTLIADHFIEEDEFGLPSNPFRAESWN